VKKLYSQKRQAQGELPMYASLNEKIPQGVIVLYINKKPSSYYFTKKTPLDRKLAHICAQKKDHGEAFVQIAEFAVKTHHVLPPAEALLEEEWEYWFGSQKLIPLTAQQDNVRGTIILPTSKVTFLYHLTGRELFIPELEKSFWRKKNPAEALAFLARFGAHTYNAMKMRNIRPKRHWQ
jgi:hypothetical protein